MAALELVDSACLQRKPKLTSREEIEHFDLVIALCEREHRPMVMARLMEVADKIIYWDIEDYPESPVHVAVAQIHHEVTKLKSSITE